MIDIVSKPYGVTIFCDDIREELGGKFTYVGVYSNELQIVSKAPVILPKLCVSVRLLIPDDINVSSIKMNITQTSSNEKNTLLEHDLEIGERKDNVRDHLSAIWHHVFSPFGIKEPCMIRVKAYIGDTEIWLGTLKIVFLSSNNTIYDDSLTSENH